MQILHLEDSANDAELIGNVLRREWPTCNIVQVCHKDAFATALGTHRFDVILSDYSMPGYDGLKALALARERSPSVPFLFLSGMIGEERAVEALKRGAADYIIKDRPARLIPAIRQALAFVQESTTRRRVEEALRENDERTRLITEHVAELISVVDVTGLRTYSNRAERQVLGEAHVTVGTNWFTGLEAADLVRVRQAFDRLVATGTPESFELRRRLPNGVIRSFEAQGAVLREGREVHVILVSRDVTERRADERRLRDQASLLDKARDAILATDLDHRITYWNASAERLYGFSATEVLGRPLNELGLRFDERTFASAAETVLRDGEWRGEFRLTTRQGTTVLVESTWSLVVEAHTGPRAILAIDTDVTARRKLELQLMRAQRLESIGTLAGGVAHDLNNVLTPVLLTLDLASANATPDLRPLLEKTRATANHGAALVRQLLAFARGADGERTNLDPAVAIATAEPLIRQSLPRDIQLDVRHPEPPWRIEANATQLHQVLLNLALNARDAMPQGGRIELTTANVTVDAALAAANPGTRPGAFLRISVSDTGVGMPASDLPYIFDPFFTTKGAGKGTGLGLSTVAGILKSHNGFVQADSELGRGSTFHLYFPALPAAMDTAPPRPKRLAQPAAPNLNGAMPPPPASAGVLPPASIAGNRS